MSDPTPYWDENIRSRRGSIVRKRKLLEEFLQRPSEERFRKLATSMWATDRWTDIDSAYVDRLVLSKSTPAEIAELLWSVIEGKRDVTTTAIPGMKTRTTSELMEAYRPSEYATFNRKAKRGMEALGYDTPPGQTQSQAKYEEFRENVREAVQKYGLRQYVREYEPRLPASATDFDVADGAFQLHATDEYDFDLAERRNRVQAIELQEDDPSLTEENGRRTVEQAVRSAQFRQRVKNYYDNTCAICGSQRETPEGNPEVEAAHIYPKRRNGSESPRNGLALCKLHHWAFDSGWISIDDNHEILVRREQELSESGEFSDLEGESILLPDSSEKAPHPKFLKKHRELHGFE